MKKITFALNEIAVIKNNEMIYTVVTADKKEPVKTYKFKLFTPIILDATGNAKMDNFIEKANAKIAELVKDLNEPQNYAEKVDGTENEYKLKKLNAVTSFVSRKTNTIKTLVIFSKIDTDLMTDAEYDFMISQTALDRKVEVQAYDGMTIAEFYKVNGAIRKSFNEFIEILADRGLAFSADMTHIELL